MSPGYEVETKIGIPLVMKLIFVKAQELVRHD